MLAAQSLGWQSGIGLTQKANDRFLGLSLLEQQRPDLVPGLIGLRNCPPRIPGRSVGQCLKPHQLLVSHESGTTMMRKQYHLRESNDGLLAWDVDRLIRLTQGLEATPVLLAEIRELDEPYWHASGGDLPTCRLIANHMRLVQDADLAHPIIICPEGRVMDGMHRVLKALLQGREFLLAYRLPILPEPCFVGVDPDRLPYDED